ncbi:MAG: CPBP family intramembrane metalloprotease [Bacilli bacterium]|nr:CPBP family intramembrane metalloprotease [Bacilli bacterium]
MNNLEKITNDLSNKFNCIMKQTFIILGYLVLTLGLQLYLFKDINSTNLLIANLSNTFINLSLLVVFIFIFRKSLIPDFYDFKKKFKTYVKKYFIYWIIAFLLSNISLNIINSFAGTPTTQAINEAYVLTLPIYSIINMVIIAPIFEELLTKVYFKKAFKNKYVYILLSGLLFGSLHLLTPGSKLVHSIPYVLLGSSFSLMYYDSDNIWTNIFYHGFHNALAIIIVVVGSL